MTILVTLLAAMVTFFVTWPGDAALLMQVCAICLGFVGLAIIKAIVRRRAHGALELEPRRNGMVGVGESGMGGDGLDAGGGGGALANGSPGNRLSRSPGGHVRGLLPGCPVAAGLAAFFNSGRGLDVGGLKECRADDHLAVTVQAPPGCLNPHPNPLPGGEGILGAG